MRQIRCSGGLLLAGILVATGTLAEEYDFEIDVAFNSTQFDGSQTITTAGGTAFNSTKTDTDHLGVSGSWYFVGLSDDEGPRSQAVLVDRASFVSINYSRSDQTISTLLTSDDPSFPFPSIDSKLDSGEETFAVNFRYVHRDSGWYGNAGLFTSNTTLSGFVSDSLDASGWSLGLGKYLFERTTLSADVGQIDVDGAGDAEVVTVSFEHLGKLGERWQYAIDVTYDRLDPDSGFELETWSAAFTLYPNRDFEFGIGIRESDGILGSDNTGIEVFASWFVKPNFGLSARYRSDNVDYFGNVSIGGAPTISNSDQDSFGVSASIRF